MPTNGRLLQHHRAIPSAALDKGKSCNHYDITCGNVNAIDTVIDKDISPSPLDYAERSRGDKNQPLATSI